MLKTHSIHLDAKVKSNCWHTVARIGPQFGNEPFIVCGFTAIGKGGYIRIATTGGAVLGEFPICGSQVCRLPDPIIFNDILEVQLKSGGKTECTLASFFLDTVEYDNPWVTVEEADRG